MEEDNKMAVTTTKGRVNPAAFYGHQKPAWANFLEAGLGAGSAALDQYNIHREKTEKWRKLGFSEETAYALSKAPQAMQDSVLMNYLEDPEGTKDLYENVGQSIRQQGKGAPGAPPVNAPTSGLNALTPQASEIYNQPLPPAIGQAPSTPVTEQAPLEAPKALELLQQRHQPQLGGAPSAPEKPMPQSPMTQALANLPAQQPAAAPGTTEALQGLQQAVAGTPQAIQAPQTATPVGRPKAEPTRAEKFAGIRQRAGFGKQPLTAYQEKQVEAKEEATTAKERARIDKETKPTYDAVTKEANAAKKGNVRLNHMEKLIESGKLNAPSTVVIRNIFKGIPFTHEALDITSLLSPETQQFEKLSYEFLNDLKDVFGSRISNLEVTNFLKRVPTLIQSDKGKISVINSLRSVNNAAIVRKKIADKIIDENNGERPRDLEQRIDAEANKELGSLAKEFTGGLKGL